LRRLWGIATPLLAVAARCSLRVSPYGPLRPKVTSSLKPEVHNVSQRCHRRTEPRPDGIYTQNFVTISPVDPEICSRTNGQTHRQIDGLITILALLPGRS